MPNSNQQEGSLELKRWLYSVLTVVVLTPAVGVYVKYINGYNVERSKAIVRHLESVADYRLSLYNLNLICKRLKKEQLPLIKEKLAHRKQEAFKQLEEAKRRMFVAMNMLAAYMDHETLTPTRKIVAYDQKIMDYTSSSCPRSGYSDDPIRKLATESKDAMLGDDNHTTIVVLIALVLLSFGFLLGFMFAVKKNPPKNLSGKKEEKP